MSLCLGQEAQALGDDSPASELKPLPFPQLLSPSTTSVWDQAGAGLLCLQLQLWLWAQKPLGPGRRPGTKLSGSQSGGPLSPTGQTGQGEAWR